MTRNATAYALTQPKIIIPALIGIAFLAKGMLIASACLFAFVLVKLGRINAAPELERHLRLRAEKSEHGIRRMLRDTERAEILKVDRYAAELVQAGCDPALARKVLEEAWQIVHEAGNKNATAKLAAFRAALPPIAAPQEAHKEPSVAEKVQEELDLVRAARKELDSISPN